MAVNLSIKYAPVPVVKCLKAGAVRHHWLLQGELIAILEAVANDGAMMPVISGSPGNSMLNL